MVPDVRTDFHLQWPGTLIFDLGIFTKVYLTFPEGSVSISKASLSQDVLKAFPETEQNAKQFLQVSLRDIQTELLVVLIC